MTTAHRPTWKAAVGRSDEGGWSAGGAAGTAISALDVASHTRLKERKGAQIVDKREALKQSLLDLERAEQTKKGRRKGGSAGLILPKRQYDENAEKQARLKLLKQTADCDEIKLKAKYDDSDVGGGSGSDDDSDLDDNDKNNNNYNNKEGGNNNDSGDESSDLDASDDSDDSSSESDDDSDDDDEAALQAELAKIRAEREKARLAAEAKIAEEENALQEEAALLGNPLLNTNAASTTSSSTNKRRAWNDDVVFRNQAKSEPAPKKRFINDTVRNDFHRRFLNKFIR